MLTIENFWDILKAGHNIYRTGKFVSFWSQEIERPDLEDFVMYFEQNISEKLIRKKALPSIFVLLQVYIRVFDKFLRQFLFVCLFVFSLLLLVCYFFVSR